MNVIYSSCQILLIITSSIYTRSQRQYLSIFRPFCLIQYPWKRVSCSLSSRSSFQLGEEALDTADG